MDIMELGAIGELVGGRGGDRVAHLPGHANSPERAIHTISGHAEPCR